MTGTHLLSALERRSHLGFDSSAPDADLARRAMEDGFSTEPADRSNELEFDLTFNIEDVNPMDIDQYIENLSTEFPEASSLTLYDLEVADQALAQLESGLEILSNRDKQYAEAVQAWTLHSLAERELTRGYEIDHTSDDSYLETVEVLEELLKELEADNEDPRLIKIAQVWRTETLAEVSVSRIRKMFELAS